MSEKNTYSEKLKEITDKLEQGIQDLFDSEKYTSYLKTIAKFHNYSFRNTLLIVMQNPQASYVAGYGAWQTKFKRQVRKGEKGIKIFAPAPYKKTVEEKTFDKDGNAHIEEKEIVVPAFKLTTVFDISQTEGEDLPMLGTDRLVGNVSDYGKFFETLKNISPVPISLEDIQGGANGYYHQIEKRIAVQENMSEVQTVKTVVHEIAHAKLHAIPENKDEAVKIDRRTREVQAESVAYTVCQHFGIDTSDYSFGYIAGWSSGRETEELKQSLEVIQNTAAEFIDAIEEKLIDREKVQDKVEKEKLSIKKQLAKNKEQPTKKSKHQKEEISL